MKELLVRWQRQLNDMRPRTQREAYWKGLVSSLIPSESLGRKLRWTQQSSPTPVSVTDGGSSASGAHEQSPTARCTRATIPSVTTSTDQNTGTGDVTREVRAGLTQDMTRTSSNDDIGYNVVMRENNADENRAEHPSSSGSDSRRRITTRAHFRVFGKPMAPEPT